MHKDLDCKVLSVMMKDLNILKYYSLNYLRLAETSLTIITKMLQL